MSINQSATFSAMLNEFLPMKMLKEEMIKRDYLLNRIEKDNSWMGGKLIVPFKGASASSLRYNGLTASSDISESKYIRGYVDGYKNIHGSLKFYEKDLMEHGKISEQNFLKILPDEIDDFMQTMKETVSMNLMNGSHYGTLTADGLDTGVLEVDHPERFEIGQKIIIKDDAVAAATGYVQSIIIDTNLITLHTTRAGGTPLDCSAYTTAENAKLYVDGADASAFQSLREALLSAANGGSTNLHNVAKTSYPYLQALNLNGGADGLAITASNLLEKLFDAYTTTRKVGKGMPNEVICSYKHLASIMKAIESSKGAYKNASATKASIYGWTEIEIVGVKGQLKVIGVHEMDDDVIMIMDWRGVKFFSNGFFDIIKDPEGKAYTRERSEAGFSYIIDLKLYGEMVISRPSHSAIIHSISY